MTGLPSIEAGRLAGIPTICTVRDYWPVCYWSDLIHTREEAVLCPGCSARMMTQCIQPHAGAAWPLALPMIPYMRGNLRRKRTGLARADAVIAVSTTIAADLRARAPELAQTQTHIIPNPVNIPELRSRAAALAPPVSGPYALYLGKLAPNKGTSHLVPAVERADLDWPLVIAGAGPEEKPIADQAARSRRDIRIVGWVDQEAAAAWLAQRVAPGLHLAGTGVAQPRAHRGERAWRSHRRDEYRRHARYRRRRGDGPPLEHARGSRETTSAGSETTRACDAGSARRRWRAPTSCSTPPRRRSGSSGSIRISSRGARSESTAPRRHRRAVGVSAARTWRSRAPCLRSDPISGRRRRSGHAHHSRTEGRTRIRTRRPYDSSRGSG